MGIRRRGCGGRLHPHPGFTRRGGVGGRRRSAQDATACAGELKRGGGGGERIRVRTAAPKRIMGGGWCLCTRVERD
eukprot:scaffold9662_cov102-Isochrysis_galbana.AAC.4